MYSFRSAKKLAQLATVQSSLEDPVKRKMTMAAVHDLEILLPQEIKAVIDYLDNPTDQNREILEEIAENVNATVYRTRNLPDISDFKDRSYKHRRCSSCREGNRFPTPRKFSKSILSALCYNVLLGQ